jgi:hypothetical protein
VNQIFSAAIISVLSVNCFMGRLHIHCNFYDALLENPSYARNTSANCGNQFKGHYWPSRTGPLLKTEQDNEDVNRMTLK